MRIHYIDPNKIYMQARNLDVPYLIELQESMRQLESVVVPILLWKAADDIYVLIDGYHRVQAARELKHKFIAAEIFEGSSEQVAEYILACSTIRSDK